MAEITAPAGNDLYRDGQTVELEGSGADDEDGELPGSSLSWTILLHHGSHLHEVATRTGETATFTPLIDHDADSHYEIILKARDSSGVVDEDRVEIYPETSQLGLSSSPPGAPIIYSGSSLTAPVTRTAAVGFRATVEAAESYTYEGHVYRFVAWSDAGSRRHEITVPVADSVYTATYRRETPPDTTITEGPTGLTAESRPRFAFSSDSAAVFQCSLDGAAFGPCTSPMTTERLEDGTHQLSVRAADRYVGTLDPTPATREFVIDSTAPAPVRFRFSRPASPSRHGAPLIFGSAEPGSEVWIYDNRDCSGGALTGGPAARFAAGGLRLVVEENSVNRLRAIALDPAGNRSPCSVEPFVYIEDSRKPVTRIRRGPDGKTADRTPTFAFRANERISRFHCRRDDLAWRRCRSPFALPKLGVGRHLFRVRAVDLAGNRGSVAHRTFSVERASARRKNARVSSWGRSLLQALW